MVWYVAFHNPSDKRARLSIWLFGVLDGMFGREDEIREAALMWERYARARVLNGGACAR